MSTDDKALIIVLLVAVAAIFIIGVAMGGYFIHSDYQCAEIAKQMSIDGHSTGDIERVINTWKRPHPR